MLLSKNIMIAHKVYINDRPLIMVEKDNLEKVVKSKNDLIAQYNGKIKYLHNYIDLMEKSQKYDQIILFCSDLDQLWTDFLKTHKIINAAGGVVFNEQNEFIAIFRRDFWDLPKGKIEENESIETAAIREVQEECGVMNVEIINPLITTWHTYTLKKNRILKRSYWFRMLCKDKILTPQTEEDIEQIIWTNKHNFIINCKPVYSSILEVINAI